uniref:Nuclear RNA export factor 3 n=1 Tax=Catagonus wagneri TaxID=51154 RepID=A0A8C3W7W9_9CETA
PQGKRRCWGTCRRRYYNLSGQVSSGSHLSFQQQQDGNPATSYGHADTQMRYTPYGIPPYHQRGSFQKRDLTIVNMDTKEKPPERKTERKRQEETLGSWFKVTIPFGIKYEEKWLLNLIQKHCGVPFTPVEFHYEKMQAQFFVENANIAFALKNVNGKIYNEAKERISVFVEPCDAPHSVQKELRSAKVAQIKLTLNKPNEGSQESLDLQRLYFDPGMATAVNLGQGRAEGSAWEGHSVKSAWEMDKGQRLGPDEMCADRNRLSTTFPDESSSIRSDVPSDGQETPPATHRAAEACQRLPTCKGSFFGSDELKSVVLQFLQQYYLIHDYGDRHHLLGVYHDEACFSLTIPFNPEDPDPIRFYEYLEENRNLKKLKDPHLRVQLLNHTKVDIVTYLYVFPKTQHDLSSFVVDMWFQTETMLWVLLSVIAVEGRYQGCVRAFTRTFIATPATSSSLCIVNDQLFVSDSSRDETESVLFIPMPTCSQQEMVCSFSITSRMNFQKWMDEPPSQK